MSELAILVEGELMGRVRADKAGRLSARTSGPRLAGARGLAAGVITPLAQQLIAHAEERLATIVGSA